MRKLSLAVMAMMLVLGLALAGCSNGDDQKMTAEKVKKEAKEAVDAAVTYTKQKHQEFMEKAKVQYQELQQETTQLMEQAQEEASQGQEKAKELMADIRAKQKVAEEKWQAFKDATADAYDKAKAELEEALKNLQEAYQKAKAELAG
ncbi:MAG: hypothetical protein K9K66_12220 [Desulfarculaceae bacterium]|nr:hypothetical protein [Desulfarculaceae bacterium]MCF8071740.1 hypothetical protein [Desulfarculaceae bacterium]MCF8102413.1 hypothetical protein [Desulfarculaceae bacterium]MCF8116755.1 hypothetical protein [Desulfarculaceae bacterium]